MSDPRIEAAARAAWIDSRNGDIGYGWDAAPEMIRKYWRRRVVPVLAGADEVDPARAAAREVFDAWNAPATGPVGTWSEDMAEALGKLARAVGRASGERTEGGSS